MGQSTIDKFLIINGIAGPNNCNCKGYEGKAGFQLSWSHFSVSHIISPAVAGLHQGTGYITATPFRAIVLDHDSTGIHNAIHNGSVLESAIILITQRVGEVTLPQLEITLNTVRMTLSEGMLWDDTEDFTKEVIKSLRRYPSDQLLRDFIGSEVTIIDFQPKEFKVAYTPVGTDGTPEGTLAQGCNLENAILT